MTEDTTDATWDEFVASRSGYTDMSGYMCFFTVNC